MRRIISTFCFFAFSALAVTSCIGTTSTSDERVLASAKFSAEKYDDRLNFYIVADGGRNGYYEQRTVADQMGYTSEVIEPEFIVSAGDTHHFEGVESINDPLWKTNFEEIYTHPELMVPWYPVLGNHEYRGDTQSVIDYSEVSRRWNMPARYYTKVVEEEGTTMRLVFVDTTPLIDKYRNDCEGYPDAVKQDIDTQLEWVDSVLTASKERWTIVIGHHPIYAYTTKKEIERINMQERLDTIMRKHNVDMYICGHIHSFQHMRASESDIDYIVNSSASLARNVKSVEGTQFCSSSEGFLIVSASDNDLEAMMIDTNGDEIYTIRR